MEIIDKQIEVKSKHLSVPALALVFHRGGPSVQGEGAPSADVWRQHSKEQVQIQTAGPATRDMQAGREVERQMVQEIGHPSGPQEPHMHQRFPVHTEVVQQEVAHREGQEINQEQHSRVMISITLISYSALTANKFLMVKLEFMYKGTQYGCSILTQLLVIMDGLESVGGHKYEDAK